MKVTGINATIGNLREKQQKNPSFGHKWSEHVSWGANYIKETGKTNFKLFSFPDAKRVFVEIANGSGVNTNNINFNIDKIKKILSLILGLTASTGLKTEKSTIYEMENKGDGVFEANDVDASPGASYRYIIEKSSEETNFVKDPFAKKQPHINGWSQVYDQKAYDWKNTRWINGYDPERITRKNDARLRGLDRLIIEEVNIPTLSQEGTFDKAKAYIDKIAKDKVANAIEIMPVENTFSLQWGYDGVGKFAVNEKLGGPDKLKELIDYIHNKRMHVIIDMVPNHIGADGNYLSKTGPYIDKYAEPWKRQWGDVFNYEQEDSKYVRDYMINAALWWANEFKVDGIRLDMTQHCHSDLFLKQLEDELAYHNPDVFIIAEDGRNNAGHVTEKGYRFESHENNLADINNKIDGLRNNTYRLKGPVKIGFDSEWDFNLKDVLHRNLIQHNIHLEDLDNAIRNSEYRVKFMMTHDEIGNQDGTRLIPKVMATYLNLGAKVEGWNDAERGQAAARVSQKLAELMGDGDIYRFTHQDLQSILRDQGLKHSESLYIKDIENAFNVAKARHKLAFGIIMTTPGPKLYFQGDDKMNLSRFKFFRQFDGPDNITDKGYDTSEKVARKDSIIDSVKIKDSYEYQMKNFSKDLVEVFNSSMALQQGRIVKSYKDCQNNVLTHHLKFGTEEVLVIKKLGDKFQDNFGMHEFPEGVWEEIFNSDSWRYGGSDYTNKDRGTIDYYHQNIRLAPNSFCILKRTR